MFRLKVFPLHDVTIFELERSIIRKRQFHGSGTLTSLLIEGKKFQDSVVTKLKGFFVQPVKTGTVTWELLVAMFFFSIK